MGWLWQSILFFNILNKVTLRKKLLIIIIVIKYSRKLYIYFTLVEKIYRNAGVLRLFCFRTSILLHTLWQLLVRFASVGPVLSPTWLNQSWAVFSAWLVGPKYKSEPESEPLKPNLNYAKIDCNCVDYRCPSWPLPNLSPANAFHAKFM